MRNDHSSLLCDTGWSQVELDKMGVHGVERELPTACLIGVTETLGAVEGQDPDPELKILHDMLAAGVIVTNHHTALRDRVCRLGKFKSRHE